MAIGSIIGAGLGAVAGTLLLPGAGTAAGAAAGASLLGAGTAAGAAIGASLGGLTEGVVKNSKANRNQIPLTDPMQTQLYQQLEQKRKQLESGTAYQAQQEAIKQVGARGMEAVAGMTGGNVGATLSAMRGMNRATGRNLNELYSNMSLEGMRMMSLMETLSEKVANRKLQLQMYDKVQMKAEGTQAIQDATKNAMGAAASLAGDTDDTDTVSGETEKKSDLTSAADRVGVEYIDNAALDKAWETNPAIGVPQIPTLGGVNYGNTVPSMRSLTNGEGFNPLDIYDAPQLLQGVNTPMPDNMLNTGI